MIAGAGSVRGKSELRRAGCRVTPGGGDSKESATEKYRRLWPVRVKRRGKSSPGSGRPDPLCKPHPVQDWYEGI